MMITKGKRTNERESLELMSTVLWLIGRILSMCEYESCGESDAPPWSHFFVPSPFCSPFPLYPKEAVDSVIAADPVAGAVLPT